ncbi:MAG: response regulator [Acidobacteriota bacterium]
MSISGQVPPLPAVPLFPWKQTSSSLKLGLAGLGLLGFFLAVGGTISLPVGGAVSQLWPAVAVQFVLALWFGWAGVAVGVLFPLLSNLLVADPLTALAFTPANFIQGALPLLLFRAFRGSPFLQSTKDVGLLAASSAVASVTAAVTGVSLQQLLGAGGESDPQTLAVTWAITNSICGFALSWPMLRWVSPVLWEVSMVSKGGRGSPFGFHLVGAAFSLTGGAVAVVILSHTLVAKGVPLPESSLAGILGVLLLPATALGVHLLWRYLAAPLDSLLRDTQLAAQGALASTPQGRDIAEFSLLRQRFAEVVAALQEGERRFRSLFETVGEPILLVDPQGRLLDANPAFQRVFGVPVARARGRNVLAFNDPEAKKQLKQLLAGPPPTEPVSLRARVRMAGKGFRQVHITAAPWWDASGNFAGYCVITADITREEERQQRLEMASRLASLQHLLAGLAHEGNNILQVEVSALENLARTHPDLVSELRPLWAAQERQRALIQRVALLAGSERQIQSESFSAGDLVAGISAASRLHPEGSLHVETPARFPVIRGNRLTLQEAVEAVVCNAFEASRRGATVEVRFFEAQIPGAPDAPDLPPGTYLVVEVADTGHGISRQNLPFVFDPFFTTRDRTAHQGVGLTLAKAAATHAGGTVTVDSTPGVGTTVRLWLPVASEEAPKGKLPAVSKRILLVDDDPQVREGLEQALCALGMEAVSASAGSQALRLVEEGLPVDAVILDLLMPEVSGFEVLEAVRQRHPDLPVILSSGFAPDERVSKALEQPHTFYLQKPYTLAQLQETLAKALSQGEGKP